MARKIVRLTLDLLVDLESPCRTCVFWETDPVARARMSPEQATIEKQAWVSQVLREWGSCGRVALVDGVPVGYLIYAPAVFVPGAAAFPTAPVSADAVVLTTARVHGAYAHGGLGRMLVQGMARDLIGRGGIRAVEAFAHTERVRRGGDCALPAEFLTSVGFKTHRHHPRHPRMRMDLRTAITWRDEVEAAIERLVGVVRPAPAATPARRAEMN